MNSTPLSTELKEEARRLGFDLVGACAAVEPGGVTRLRDWIEAGYTGQMHYIPARETAYAHPRHVLEGARSILMLAINYRTEPPAPAGPGQGRISRYAWGTDYHDVVHLRLRRLVDWLRDRAPSAAVRGVVDTAPLLEREFAQLAGLGWVGKNTLLLNRQLGSWFFLAALLTDLELDIDAAHETDHCGTCRACLDACPTGAFVDAYVLDSRKCISYTTIELRDAVPHQMRAGHGQWLFGCDICQDVCPWNREVPLAAEPGFRPAADTNPVELASLFDLDDAAFRHRFRHTPLWRAKRRGILRNAAIVLGNSRHPDGLPALVHGLSDAETLIRGASAWALGRYKDPAARQALGERLAMETDSDVVGEIRAALSDSPPAAC